MRLVFSFLAAVVLAAPSDAVRVNLPTDRTVDLFVGQKVELTIAGNPTTGYKWSVASMPEGITEVGEAVYVQDPADSPGGRRLVGVGGRFIFTFVGSKATEGSIKLVYTRPWEKDTPPIQTADVKVRVIAR
jgi:inhibitor of cysteine peptidase